MSSPLASKGSLARTYEREAVLGQAGNKEIPPWLPFRENSAGSRCDYEVSGNQFRTLQAAIDQSIIDAEKSGNSARRVIRIGTGLYDGPVFIPREAPPLMIIGEGAEAVTIAANIDAQMSGDEYQARFGEMIRDFHPVTRAHFERIFTRKIITTNNACVFRVERNDVIIMGLKVENTYSCDRPEAAPVGAQQDEKGRFAEGQHQAVALHIAGADRVHLSDLYLSSFQDTLYLQAPPMGLVARCYLSDCLIEGDVDFIFGGATAFFENCEIKSRGERGAQSWATAPSTNLHAAYGFVFSMCRFTNDGGLTGHGGAFFLGRQWFEGVRATPYGVANLSGYTCKFGDDSRFEKPHGTISRQTLEAVGKCIIINSEFGPHINSNSPWDGWNSANWNLRFRPAQFYAKDFLEGLQEWLLENGLDYAEIDPNERWLGVLSGDEN